MLKHDICEEIDSVFMNLYEFAEPITLDRKKLLAVVDRTEILFPEDGSDGRLAVAYDSVTLWIKKTDIKLGKFYPGKETTFNGERWHVLSCDGEDIVTLKLYKERT